MAEESNYGRERYRRINLAGNEWAETWLQRLGDRVDIQTNSSSAGGGGGSYQRCSQKECLGEALPNIGTCFPHSNQDARTATLNQAPHSNAWFTLRGTCISQSLWDEIARSPLFMGGTLHAPIMLAGAEVDASIHLDGVTFAHDFHLNSAVVYKQIELRNCVFRHTLSARFCLFKGGALDCGGSTFNNDLDLSCSTIERTSFGFRGCTFEKDVNLYGLSGVIYLDKSTVRGNFSCRDGKAWLIMNGCELDGAIDLSRCDLIALHGERLVAHSALQVGPCVIPHLYLKQATFDLPLHLDVSANDIDMTGATMKEGGLLLIEKAKMCLEQLSLGGPLKVSSKARSIEEQPEILSLRNSDAGQMSLSRVNLARCSFVGVHRLGALDIGSTVTFARAPFWAGRRRFIADEFAWRGTVGALRRIGWKLEGVLVGVEAPKRVPGYTPPILLSSLMPAQVEGIYRELRRGFENKSDMSGAADFYYGEMEMRRWSRTRSVLERALVWCYWALSGYGVRPGRAALAWLFLVAAGSKGLFDYGWASSPANFSQALLVAIRAAIPSFASEPDLTLSGRCMETGIRVFGTMFVALFVLAARSIVMRKPGE